MKPTKQRIDRLVNLFLAWPLPSSVCADLCTTNPEYKFPRSGTNLLSAEEARQMIEYLLTRDDEWRFGNLMQAFKNNDITLPPGEERKKALQDALVAVEQTDSLGRAESAIKYLIETDK